MYAVADYIKTRLAADAALAQYDVRVWPSDASRRTVPAIEIVCDGAQSAEVTPCTITLEVQWQIQIHATADGSGLGRLDDALATIIARLHNHRPGEIAGRKWARVRLVSVQRPEYAEQGHHIYALTFATTAKYQGQTE